MSLSLNVDNNFTEELNKKIYEYKNSDFSDIVFLCIGTDRITGDSFGPLVGEKLSNLFENINNKNILVVGTLKEPVCATNIENALKSLKVMSSKPYIVAIDAAFSKKENIGKVIISNQSMYLGKGLNKKQYNIGNISIKGIVAKDYKIPKVNFSVLQNTSLNLVMNLAEYTANGIYEAIRYV